MIENQVSADINPLLLYQFKRVASICIRKRLRPVGSRPQPPSPAFATGPIPFRDTAPSDSATPLLPAAAIHRHSAYERVCMCEWYPEVGMQSELELLQGVEYGESCGA